MSRFIFLVLAIAVAVTAEVIQFEDCEDFSDEHCKVSEVRINPCTNKKMCRLKKGRDTHISFDFTPNFSATKLKTDVYWTTVAWSDLDPDACKATSCPSVAGQMQQFNTTMHLGKKLPSGIFRFKWQVYDEADEQKKCCFVMTIHLRK